MLQLQLKRHCHEESLPHRSTHKKHWLTLVSSKAPPCLHPSWQLLWLCACLAEGPALSARLRAEAGPHVFLLTPFPPAACTAAIPTRLLNEGLLPGTGKANALCDYQLRQHVTKTSLEDPGGRNSSIYPVVPASLRFKKIPFPLKRGPIPCFSILDECLVPSVNAAQRPDHPTPSRGSQKCLDFYPKGQTDRSQVSLLGT